MASNNKMFIDIILVHPFNIQSVQENMFCDHEISIPVKSLTLFLSLSV